MIDNLMTKSVARTQDGLAILPRRHNDQVKLPAVVKDDSDPVFLYLDGLDSTESQKTMYRCIRQFAVFFIQRENALPANVAWSEVDYGVVKDFMRGLKSVPFFDKSKNKTSFKELSPATRNLYLTAVRGVLKKAAKIKSVHPLKKVEPSVYEEIREIKLVKGSRVSDGQALEISAVEQLVDSLDKKVTPLNIRDKAIFLVMVGCGLRVNELVSMDFPKNVDFTKDKIKIIGKGNKERSVDMSDPVASALLNYIENVRGEGDGHLWHPMDKWGHQYIDRRLSTNAIRKMLKTRSNYAGITEVKPHDLRRTLATMLLSNGHDLLTVQDILGHNSADTTKKYDLRGDRQKKVALQSIWDKNS